MTKRDKIEQLFSDTVFVSIYEDGLRADYKNVVGSDDLGVGIYMKTFL